jgi:anti-sigma B factor antagonist
MKSVVVALLSGSPEAVRAQVVEATRATLSQGKMALILALDTLQALDDPALNAVIIALRTMRAAGGTVRLVTSREDHRSRLSLTGLDRVFEIFATVEEAERAGAAPESRKDRIRFAIRAASAAIALLIGTVLFPAAGRAQVGPNTAPSEPAALAVLSKLIERNANLQSFEADMRVEVRMLSFPFLRPVLTGKAYFKRPASYEVVFDRLPAYAKGLEHLYADIGSPSTWDKRFVVTVDGERLVNGRRQIALRMVQRVRGMLDHEEVIVDEPSWTISELQYHYYNGGVIALRQGFSMINGYAMVTSQIAEIRIPYLRAIATATYTGYQTNVAIDDAVFAKNRQAEQ